jgi:hypothetical protein
LVIRGKKTTDKRTIASLLVEESKRTSLTGSLQTAYKKPQTALFYTFKTPDTHTTLKTQPTYPIMFQVPVPRKKLGSKADKKDGNGTTQTGDRLWFEKFIR